MKIVLIPGDGIGPEQMNATKKVLYAIKDILSLKFELEEVEAGDQALAKYGKALPDHTLAK
ncbi:MAG: 3-isopropylmalate dehydrogenase, partial [Candidatus Nitrosothermus koennekii]